MKHATSALGLALLLATLAPASPVRAQDDAFDTAIANARGEALLEHPDASLGRYRDALAAAGADATRMRMSRFGIARMLLSLGRFDEAHVEYTALLATSLSPEDREIALDGSVRSLLALDRPISAYRLVRDDAPIDNPRLTLSAARAANEGGRPEAAHSILARHRADIERFAPGSRLQSEARRVARDVAEETDVNVGLTQSFAHDSDGQTTNETTLLLRQPLPSGDVVSYRARRLALSGAISSVQNAGVYGATYAAKPSDALTLSLAADVAQYGAWHPSFVSASVAYQPIDALRLVASLNPSAVETQLGLANRIHSDAFVFHVTGRPNALVRLDGSAYATHFSDGNHRVGYFGSAAFGIPSVAGLSFAIRSRGFADRTTPLTGYFSPKYFSEQQLIFSERARIRSWIVSVQTGVGHETISPETSSTTALLSLGARGPIGGCLALDTSASNSTSGLASASGYRRTSASIALSCRL